MAQPRQKYPLLIALLVLGLGVWAFYELAAFTSRAGTTAPLFSHQRHDPYGTAALHSLLDARGRPVRLLKSPRQLQQAEGVLLQVLPFQTQETGGASGVHQQLSADRLKQWIAQGHTVVQMTRQRTPLMAALDVPAGHMAADLAKQLEKQQRQGQPPKDLPGTGANFPWLVDDPGLPGLETTLPLNLRAPRYFVRQASLNSTRPATAPATQSQSPKVLPPALPKSATQPATQAATQPIADRWQPLAGQNRVPVAGRLPHGEGQLIVIGAPTPALNQALGEPGNLALMLALAEPGPLWLDGWSLGTGYTGSVMGLIRRFGLLPAVLQVVLVIAVFHWASRGHQRTPPPRTPRRRSATEQLGTLGYLFNRSMPADELARRTYDTVLRRLALALGWPVKALEPRLGITPGAEAGSQPADPTLAQVRSVVEAARTLAGRFPVKCRRCGYNLVGSAGPQCPECGEPTTPQQRQQLAARPATLSSEAATPTRPQVEKQAMQLIDRTHDLTQELARGH
jgi:ribosomal protein L37E